MTPMTLMTLMTIFITFIGMASATSTNITYTNQPLYYTIIKDTIEPYGDFNEFLRIREVEMVYYNISGYIINNDNDNDNININIKVDIPDFVKLVMYLYMIFIIFTYNSKPVPEPVPEPEPTPTPTPKPIYKIPDINIKEVVVDDNEDSDDNCTIYKTHKIELTVFDIDEVKIDDIIQTGECYLEVLDQLLYTHNYKTVKFTNLTYRDLVKLLTSTHLKLPNNHISMDSINKNKQVDGITIISIDYN
jgi:hypothetical protein